MSSSASPPTSTTQHLSFDDSITVAPSVDADTVHTAEYKHQLRARRRVAQIKSEVKDDKLPPPLWKSVAAKYDRRTTPHITSTDASLQQKQASTRLKRHLQHHDKKVDKAVETVAQSELLLTEEGGSIRLPSSNTAGDTVKPEPTTTSASNSSSIGGNSMLKSWHLTQRDLLARVEPHVAKRQYDMKLPEFGPYISRYTPNGRSMLVCGRKGHIMTYDAHTMYKRHEFHVQESIYDACWLHNETMYAVAQKKYLYIYDNRGIELHCLRNHKDPLALQYLPYHYLLVSINRDGWLKYQDISTGEFVHENSTKFGLSNVMTQNRTNGVIVCGHTNGQITMWSPNMSTSLVNILAHRGQVNACEVAMDGNHLVSAGLDGQIKVWDLRTYKLLHSYFSTKPTEKIDVSDTGMMAIGYGQHINIWKDALRTKQKAPYLKHMIPASTVTSLQFQPYEDALSIGHTNGVQSMIVPGSGEPNIDTYEGNPYQTKKQRREHTVHTLLEKLRPDMITLNNNDLIGMMNQRSATIFAGERASMRQQRYEESLKVDVKDKSRGKNKDGRRQARKHKNIVDKKTMHFKELSLQRQKEQQREQLRKQGVDVDNETPSALSRFQKK